MWYMNFFSLLLSIITVICIPICCWADFSFSVAIVLLWKNSTIVGQSELHYLQARFRLCVAWVVGPFWELNNFVYVSYVFTNTANLKCFCHLTQNSPEDGAPSFNFQCNRREGRGSGFPTVSCQANGCSVSDLFFPFFHTVLEWLLGRVFSWLEEQTLDLEHEYTENTWKSHAII